MKVNIKQAFNKKRILAILLVVFAVLVMVISNPEIKDFFSKPSTLKLNFQTGVEYDIVEHGKEVLLVNNEGIFAIDKSGREAWSIVSAATSPFVQKSGKYIMLADINGKEVKTFKKENIVAQIKTENEILTAKVNNNGYVAVATDELGFKGLVSLYGKGGNELFKWHSGSGYIGDIDISPNNKLAAAQIMTDKEALYSKILLINPSSEKEPECIAEVPGIVAKLKFNDDSSLVVLTDKGLYAYKRSGKQKFAVDFGGRNVLKVNLENKNNMVLAFDSGLNSTVLESYSFDGKLRGSFDCGSEVRAIDVNGECIVASTHDRLVKLSPKGKLKQELKASKDVKAIKIFDGRGRLLSLGDNSAEIIDIK